MKKLIGWLANFYPNHVFYSDHFMPDLVLMESDGDDPHETKGNTATIGVAVAASRIVEPGGTFTAEYTVVTNQGRDVGDYKITIERSR